MTRYEYRRCRIKLDVECAARASLSVWAVKLPPPFHGLRFCLRRIARGWIVDHYDSGKIVTSARGPTRDLAVDRLIQRLCAAHAGGRLRRVFADVGYAWCLDEAGL